MKIKVQVVEGSYPIKGDVKSLMYKEDGTPIMYDRGHGEGQLGQVSSSLWWAKQDISYARYQDELDSLFPEARGEFEFEFEFIPMKRKGRTIEYTVSRWDEGQVDFDIEASDLIYAQLGEGSHHGLQCNHIGGTLEHNEIIRKLKKITELFNEIETLNDPNYKIVDGKDRS